MRAGRASARLRAILVLLLGLTSDTLASSDVRQFALSRDDLLAAAAVMATLLGRTHPGCLSMDESRWRGFWGDALADPLVGPLLDPNHSIDDASDAPVEPQAGGEFANHHVPTAWRDAATPHRAFDDATRDWLETVATSGQSSVARMIAIRHLSTGDRTDQIATAILQDDKGTPLLRALAYQALRHEPANWALFEKGLKEETNDRVLASVISYAAPPPEHKVDAVKLIEDLLRRPEVDAPIDSVTDALSFSETQEGLDALVRLARLGRSENIRIAAGRALGDCPYGSAFTQQRVPLLLGLIADADPAVAASGAIGLLQAAASHSLGDGARAAMDSSVKERIQALGDDPHVPQSLRQTLSACLQFSREQFPKK